MSAAQPIAELPRDRFGDFATEAVQAFRPVVMRGLAAHWPLLAAAKGGVETLGAYLARFDRGKPVEVMTAPADIEGRFFHEPDMRGFNFRTGNAPIGQILAELGRLRDEPRPPGLYAGAILAADHLPGLTEANPLPLDLQATDAMPRLWLGNASYVSPHFDLSDNVAVVVGGRRRFTLYPPEQTPNLYVGPFNMTPAGQPVSMVDPREPDLARYPRFADAMASALTAELEPGDAIYIPTLWWHGVEALEPVNLLVNYWHNHPQDGGAFLALVHALSAVRDEPRPRREAWRVWFDHFIFGDEANHAADHLPLHAKGILGPASKNRSEAIRTYLLRALSRS